jgi:ribosomal protein L14E/L6E/L27E
LFSEEPLVRALLLLLFLENQSSHRSPRSAGPYKFNGVPLKRVNQAYVIATSQKLDISKVNVDPKFNDDYFKRPAEKKTKQAFLKKDEKVIV